MSLQSVLIDWDSDQSHVLLNPRLPEDEVKELTGFEELFRMPGHLWVTSSGSSRGLNQSLKLVALSKSAFLDSAKAVNQFLQASAEDKWALFLPLFHVGGLSILARAFLSNSQVKEFSASWDPQKAFDFLNQEQISFVSFVPTQLVDIVDRQLTCPKSLKAVFVGGAKLETDILERAFDLGWPIIPSYGMTETSSMIALRPLNSDLQHPDDMQILSHVKVRLDSSQNLEVFGRNLLTGYAQRSQGDLFFKDPKLRGWFRTSDQAILNPDGAIRILGRDSDFAKIKGEGVSLTKLNDLWSQYSKASVIFTFMSDARDGQQVALIIKGGATQANNLKAVIEQFNKVCLPFERIQRRFYCESWPVSPLGKPLLSEIIQKATQF